MSVTTRNDVQKAMDMHDTSMMLKTAKAERRNPFILEIPIFI